MTGEAVGAAREKRAIDANSRMSAADNFVKLVCPGCSREGNAGWLRGNAGGPRKLNDLSAGFLSIDAGSKDGPRIVCQKCRIRADEHSLR